MQRTYKIILHAFLELVDNTHLCIHSIFLVCGLVLWRLITVSGIDTLVLYVFMNINLKIQIKKNQQNQRIILNRTYIKFLQVSRPFLQIKRMSQQTQPRPKKVYDVIQPNTNRVLQMRRIKQEKQRQQRKLQQKLKKIKQEQERKKWTIQKMKEQQKKNQMMKRMQEERRKKQQQQESNTLSGRFGHMINDLNTNTTNLQFTTSGMDLRPAQIKVLISNVQNNSSLKGLTMCRKRLTDVQGKDVSQNLKSNIFLQRLQLQGNNLGSQSLSAIAQLLSTNQSIRLIDLEGNKIIKGSDDKPNYQGISDLMQTLKQNQTLLTLNLNSTGLDDTASRMLRVMMESNSTLILLDIQNNPDMNIDDVIVIQDQLIENKQQYDDERYMEFIERKRMRRQQDISGVILLNKQTKKLRSQAIELNIKTKKAQLDEQWEQFLKSKELQRQKQIIRMQKQATSKKGKKKKK